MTPNGEPNLTSPMGMGKALTAQLNSLKGNPFSPDEKSEEEEGEGEEGEEGEEEEGEEEEEE